MDRSSKFPKVLLDVAAGIVESDASDKEKVRKVLDTLQTWPGASRLTESEVHIGEFHLRLDLPGRTRQRAENLKSIEGLGLGLAVAPEVVALVDVVPADTLLVSRYSACAGETLRRVQPGGEPFTDAARERFLRDMRVLGEHGLTHRFVTRGTYYWYVSSKTGTIVLYDWSLLAPCQPGELEPMMLELQAMTSIPRRD